MGSRWLGFGVGVVAVCGCVLPAKSQAGPSPPVPSPARYRIEQTGDTVTINDLSDVPITGFRAAYDCGVPGKESSVLEDTVIMGMGLPQPPKNTLTFEVPQVVKGCPGGVTVIAFSDGQHQGSPEAWKQVVLQRSAAYAEASGLLSLAEGISPADWSGAGFASQVGQIRETLRANRTLAPDERRGRLMALDVFTAYLATERPGTGTKKASARTQTIQQLIHWMTALGDALGNEKVEMSSAVAGAK